MKNMFSVGFGEQFGEQNHSKSLMFESFHCKADTVDVF